jgi:hypothetical protein
MEKNGSIKQQKRPTLAELAEKRAEPFGHAHFYRLIRATLAHSQGGIIENWPTLLQPWTR